MIILKATTELLEVVTSTTAAIDVVASYADLTTTTFVASSQETNITTATTTTIVSSPAASTQRQIKFLTIENKGTASNTVTLRKDISGTKYVIYSMVLFPGENLSYVDGTGFDKHAASGSTSILSTSDKLTPINARSFNFLKVGAATEAAGLIHSLYASTGTPGVWSTGAPGLNGRATDGTNATDAGCIPIKNPASGVNYLTAFLVSATTASTQLLIDFMWVNTGLVVTTTTAQAITPAALPARDLTGTTNGEDVQVGLLVTASTTNAAAIANCTISYTNSSGTAGKTGTMSAFPATATLGALIPFQLASGDIGVRSVESVTLGTSLVTGSVSLVLYRIIAGAPHLVANAGGSFNNQTNLNVRLFNNICLIPAYIATATTATTVSGIVNVEEK